MARTAKPATADAPPNDAGMPAPETQPTVPESAAGAGEPPGAVAAAPGATPTIAPPATSTPSGLVVQVVGPAAGRWRIGRKFGPEAVSIPLDDLTDDQKRALIADPLLVVTTVPAA